MFVNVENAHFAQSETNYFVDYNVKNPRTFPIRGSVVAGGGFEPPTFGL